MVCFKNCNITGKHVHCCIHVRFWDGIFQFLGRAYLVCVPSSRPILLVRTSFHTVFSCDNNSVFITLHSEHQQIFWWDVSQHDETHHTPLFWQQVQYTSCCIEATSTLYIRDGPPITMHPCGSGGRGGVKSDHPTIASEPAVSRCSSAPTGTAYQVYV